MSAAAKFRRELAQSHDADTVSLFQPSAIFFIEDHFSAFVCRAQDINVVPGVGGDSIAIRPFTDRLLDLSAFCRVFRLV